MGREHPQVLFYDFFSWNFYEDNHEQKIFFCLFNSNTADKFARSFIVVDRTLGMSAPHIYTIHKNLNANSLTYEDLNYHLCSMIDPLYQSTKSMRSLMNTSRFDSEYYVNPALWSKTIAPVGGSTRKGEIGMSGGAAPSFKLLDIFFGRKNYDSELGRQQMQKTFLKKHTEFMNLIQSSSKKIIDFISGNQKALHLFHQISQLYYGETGYLGLHQKKVYGFMLVGLSAGRTDTNGGTLKTDQNTAVKELDQEFTKARDERGLQIKSNYPLKMRVKQAISISHETKHIILDAKDKLFKIWPGDKLSVLPKNSEESVQKYLNVCKNICKPDSNFKLLNLKWQKFIELQGLEMSGYDDLLKIILTHGDLIKCKQTEVNKFFEVFKITRLGFPLNWIEKQGVLFFIEILNKESKTLKSEFLEWLTEVIEPMSNRYYSICTSPKELSESGDLGMTVGLLKYEENIGKCSGYLHSLKVDDQVDLRPVYSYWNIPDKKETPIIMIAGGTGISPMLALLKHRSDIGCFDNNLFFVTKNLENFYFQHDLENFVKEKQLRFFGSFTRDSKTCESIKKTRIDIVTLLKENRALLNKLVSKNASIYVCGRIEFAQKVSDTLTSLLEDTIEKEKIPQKIVAMKHQGQYIEEAFTSHKSSIESNLNGICITDVLSNDNLFCMNRDVYDVSEFKKVHPGGDFVFLVSSETDYNQVHGNDPIARNMLNSLKKGHIINLDKFEKSDIQELEKLKNLIGKYYCATDIPAADRTASMLVEHQNSFVKNFQSCFKDSHLEALQTISNHSQFSDSSDLIKVLTKHMSQDFIAFLWENVETFNFKFLFSLRKYLISLLRSGKLIQFNIFQNPYEEFTKYIFGFKKVTPSSLRNSINTLQKNTFSRLNSQLAPISDDSTNALSDKPTDNLTAKLVEAQLNTNSIKETNFSTNLTNSDISQNFSSNNYNDRNSTSNNHGINLLRKLKNKYS